MRHIRLALPLLALLAAAACWKGKEVISGPVIPTTPGTGTGGDTSGTGGTTLAWTQQSTGTTDALHGVWGQSDSSVFAVGENGRVVRWNGVVWTPLDTVQTLTINALQAVWGASDSSVFVVGATGTVLRYDGAVWRRPTMPTTSTLFGVWGTDTSHVWAVGANGTILRYDGSAWTLDSSGTTNALRAVWGTSATDVWAVGDGATALHFDGTRWTADSTGLPLQVNLTDVFALSPTFVVASTDNGTLRIRDAAGWRSLATTADVVFTSVRAFSTADIYAGAIADGIYHSDGTTLGVVSSSPALTIEGLWAQSATSIWGVGPNGIVVHGKAP